MNETLVIVIYSLATFSMTIISLVTLLRWKQNKGYIWLSLIFFSPVIAYTTNILIYEDRGIPIIHLLSIFTNLSYGGYLIMALRYFRNETRAKYFWLLFSPSYLYFIFIVYSIFDPQYIIDSVRGTGNISMGHIINNVANIIMVVYSMGANAYLLILEIKDKTPRKSTITHSIRKEFLAVQLVLQMGAFVPFLLRLDALYIILYMPVFGQIFFLFLFFRLTPNAVSSFHDIFEQMVKEKYSGIKLEQQRIDEILYKIKFKMEKEKLYLNEECNLQSFSQLVNESSNIVSMIINQHFNTTFPDFLNQYRVQESIKMLSELKDKKYSIEGIAYECGFGNRTSFYNAFKKHTGMLPNEYKLAINEK
jgi:AraC-like DNA-binding protein